MAEGDKTTPPKANSFLLTLAPERDRPVGLGLKLEMLLGGDLL
jgi:hypothetical protein